MIVPQFSPFKVSSRAVRRYARRLQRSKASEIGLALEVGASAFGRLHRVSTSLRHKLGREREREEDKEPMNKTESKPGFGSGAGH